MSSGDVNRAASHGTDTNRATNGTSGNHMGDNGMGQTKQATVKQSQSTWQRWMIGAATAALLTSACGIPSFEERQAALDDAETTEVNELDSDGESTSDDNQERVDGPVLADAEPDDGLDDPTWADLALETVVIAEYEEPISLKSRSGSNDLWIAQRSGIVRRIQRTFNKNGVERLATDTSVVLDISELVSVDGERGLLDIEFSLDGRLLFVSYTDIEGALVVAEFDIARSSRANAASQRELLRIQQPASNHNGGSLVIGADGFLYIGVGDGGGSGDPDDNAQNTDTLLGSILRIDPLATETSPYLIPDGNPFVDGDGAPEIFLFGVRNPWRFSFDGGTDDMWIADVGQDGFEEVNRLAASQSFGNGANLGWNQLEAFEPFEGGTPPTNTIYPVFAYSHENGRCSVTGGHVYRGAVIPLLDGVYVFGDYCSGEVFGLEVSTDTVLRPLSFDVPDDQLVSIGTGPDGELYLVLAGGEIRRVQPAVAIEE